MDGSLNQKQLSSLFDKIDDDFLIDGRVEFARTTTDRIRKEELPPEAIKKPKIIIFKRSAKGILETNPTGFEFFSTYFQTVSKDIVNSNFAVNSIDLDSISKKPDYEKRIAKFVSQLKIANALVFVNEKDQANSMKITWNENAHL